jgi:hypothetical protein
MGGRRRPGARNLAGREGRGVLLEFAGIEIRNQGDDPFAALAGSNQLFA